VNVQTATYLLFLLGCLGAADIALFHSVAHGIRSHAESVGELVTHSLRGPTYAFLFLVIPNFTLHGWFAWGLLAVFVVDVAISIWDFSLEQKSRRFLGGLPGGEYVLHMLMAMVFGAFVTACIYDPRVGLAEPTQLAYAPAAVPVVLRLMLLVMAGLVLLSGIEDALAVLRLRGVAPRAALPPAISPPPQPTPAPERLHLPRRPAPAARESHPGGWMRAVLVAAGAYNLLWGSWVVFFPTALFRWIGVAPMNYPPIWQCLGMIVGVYGIGYLIAARAPVRHWPIVFVGLLGKVLGPAGMWWSLTTGSLPPSMAWVCFANDLVWWLPFALVLRRAIAAHLQER